MKLIDNVSGNELTTNDAVTSAVNGETYLYQGLIREPDGQVRVVVRGAPGRGLADKHLVSPEALDARIEE